MVGGEEFDVGEYILALLYYAGRPLSKTHIMKILAFYAVLTGREDFFDFAPYRFGLYSPEVDSILEEGLRAAGLVVRDRGGYQLTEEGLREAVRIVERMEKVVGEDASLLRRLALRLSRLRAEELMLLHYVMLCSEDCRRASDVWRKLKERRVEIALNLLRRGVVSWRLAARLSGMALEDFARLAEEKGVRMGDKLHFEDIEAAIRDYKRLHIRGRLYGNSNS
jgi:predicted HTH domain antitoxin